MSLYQLPVSNLPNQTFTTTIPNANGDNISWIFKFNWNLCTNTWELTLFKGSEDNPIAYNIPVIVSSNILDYISYKEDIGALLVINVGTSDDDRPSMTKLGVDYILVWDNLND